MSERLYERIAELQEQLRQGAITRRDFLRYATLIGVSVGAAEALAACAPKVTPTRAPTVAPPPTAAPPPSSAAGTTAPTAPPPAAVPSPAAPAAGGVEYPGFAWDPPYKALHVDYDKCTGCRICEGACSIKNFGEFNPELSRIRIYDFYAGQIQVPSICWGCQWEGGAAKGGLDSPCMEACPTNPKAISWSTTVDAPVVDEKLCIKCGLCYENCAQHAMKLNPKTGFPNVCNRCDGDPECAKACPVGAIQPWKTKHEVQRAFGVRTIESIAEDQVQHLFYPWKGLEDWKKVGA